MKINRIILGIFVLFFSLVPNSLQAGCVLKEGDRLGIATISSAGIWSALCNADKSTEQNFEILLQGEPVDDGWKKKYGNSLSGAFTYICKKIGPQNIFTINTFSIMGTFFIMIFFRM